MSEGPQNDGSGELFKRCSGMVRVLRVTLIVLPLLTGLGAPVMPNGRQHMSEAEVWDEAKTLRLY
jgi:hypothetical protein